MTDPGPRETAFSRVETGVGGLDQILGGGSFRGGVYIVRGSPGHSLHEFVITGMGIEIQESVASAETILSSSGDARGRQPSSARDGGAPTSSSGG